MSTTAPGTPEPTNQADCALLHELRYAEVRVQTGRRVAGRDENDPGLRDFTAAVTLYVYLGDRDERDLPEWYLDPDYAGVSDQDKRDLLARVSPLLAEAALDVAPAESGVEVQLVHLAGSILDPFRLRGDLYDALDARSGAHEALSAALTEDEDGYPDLAPDLDEQVTGFGTGIVLLTDISSSNRWEQLAPGLEVGLVSLALQDVAAGARAVLAQIPDPGTAEPELVTFFAGLSFTPWRRGIGYASPGLRAFEAPAERVADLLG